MYHEKKNQLIKALQTAFQEVSNENYPLKELDKDYYQKLAEDFSHIIHAYVIQNPEEAKNSLVTDFESFFDLGNRNIYKLDILFEKWKREDLERLEAEEETRRFPLGIIDDILCTIGETAKKHFPEDFEFYYPGLFRYQERDLRWIEKIPISIWKDKKYIPFTEVRKIIPELKSVLERFSKMELGKKKEFCSYYLNLQRENLELFKSVKKNYFDLPNEKDYITRGKDIMEAESYIQLLQILKRNIFPSQINFFIANPPEQAEEPFLDVLNNLVIDLDRLKEEIQIQIISKAKVKQQHLDHEEFQSYLKQEKEKASIRMDESMKDWDMERGYKGKGIHLRSIFEQFVWNEAILRALKSFIPKKSRKKIGQKKYSFYEISLKYQLIIRHENHHSPSKNEWQSIAKDYGWSSPTSGEGLYKRYSKFKFSNEIDTKKGYDALIKIKQLLSKYPKALKKANEYIKDYEEKIKNERE